MSASVTAPLVRPMTDADIPQVATVTAEAFETEISTPRLAATGSSGCATRCGTDPDGSFVSERDGVVTGAAQAVIREGLWILSLMAVSPTLGVGRRGPRADGGGAGLRPWLPTPALIIASDDPRALRLYASSGFRARADLQGHGHGRSER